MVKTLSSNMVSRVMPWTRYYTVTFIYYYIDRKSFSFKWWELLN